MMQLKLLLMIFSILIIAFSSFGCASKPKFKHFKRPEKLVTCQMDAPRSEGICGVTDTLEKVKRVPLSELDKYQMFSPESFKRLKTFMDLCKGK